MSAGTCGNTLVMHSSALVRAGCTLASHITLTKFCFVLQLLAKEVKNLRQQLQEQKQQVPQRQAEDVPAGVEATPPVSLHIHIATASSEQPEAASPANRQAATPPVPQTQPDASGRISQASAAVQTDTTEASALETIHSPPDMAETATQTNDAVHTASSNPHALPPADLLTGSFTSERLQPPDSLTGSLESAGQQPADLLTGSADELGQQPTDLVTGSVGSQTHQPADLLTGSTEAIPETSAQVQQIPLTLDLLGLDMPSPDSSGLAAAVSGTHQQPLKQSNMESLGEAQIMSSVTADSDQQLPELQTVDAQPTTSIPADLSSDAQTDAVPGHAQPAAAPHSVVASQSGAAAEEHAAAQHAQQPQAGFDPESAKQYKQLLQEVAALRQRLHDCSVEALEGTCTYNSSQ